MSVEGSVWLYEHDSEGRFVDLSAVSSSGSESIGAEALLVDTIECKSVICCCARRPSQA
jgi:hypothetical protein